MRFAVLDTETTGIIRRGYDDPAAPYLAALAMVIYDSDKERVEASFNTMIQPDGWTMPPEAGAVNGLDDETLALYGLPVTMVLHPTIELLLPVDLIIGHNVIFDIKILAAALYRADMLGSLEALLSKDTYCTMQESKSIVQAKTANGRLKNPKLTEAYEFFFDRPLDSAHSANADVIATLEIYLALQEIATETPAPAPEDFPEGLSL